MRLDEFALGSHWEVYAIALYPQMTIEGSDHCVHTIYNVGRSNSYYLKIEFNLNSTVARRIQQSTTALEAFFVQGSSLAIVTDTLMGYQAYIAGQIQGFSLNPSGLMNLGIQAGTIHSAHAPSTTSCRNAPSAAAITISKDVYLTSNYVSPTQFTFDTLALTTAVEDFTAEVAILTSPIDMNLCYAGD